jgi:hypothetical protein
MALCRASALTFWLVVVLELGLVSFCTFWPIRKRLRSVRAWEDWLDLYSVNSNLDVWLQCVLHCLILPLCFLRVAGQVRRHRRRYASARTAISIIVYTCQVLLIINILLCAAHLA